MNIVLFDAEELTTAPPGASPLAARAPGTPASGASPPGAGAAAIRLAAADRRARHMVHVLGLSPGDTFRAGVVNGPAGRATLAAVEAGGGLRIEFEAGAGAQAVTAHAGGVGATGPESPVAEPRPLHSVRLLLGHPRPIVLRRLLRDLSTLGIEQLVVVRTELGEKSYLESKLWQGDDVRRLLIEGAEQAGSTLLPRVEKAWRLSDAIGKVVEGRETAPRVVYDNEDAAPGGAVAPEAAVAPGTASAGPSPDAAAGPGTPATSDGRDPAGPGRIIAVGSERGWTDVERGLLRDNGFQTAGLGRRILRTETAAIAAVTVALRESGRI